MKKTTRLDPEKKIKAVSDFLAGEYSLRQLAATYKVHHSSIEHWVTIYKVLGPEGFYQNGEKQKYSDELKKRAVLRYLSTEDSMNLICEEYHIRSVSQLQYWLNQYKKGKKFL